VPAMMLPPARSRPEPVVRQQTRLVPPASARVVTASAVDPVADR
jgi:hypothetical protein